MPWEKLKQTKFVKSLKAEYGDEKAKEVFYAIKNKYPKHHAILKAEGKGWHRNPIGHSIAARKARLKKR